MQSQHIHHDSHPSCTMINFEIDAARRERVRTQNNFHESAFGMPDDEVAYVETTAAPDPEERTVLRFKAGELQLRSNASLNGAARQVIIDENSTSAELVEVAKDLRQQIKRIREETRAKLREAWQQLLATNRVKKTRWIKSQQMAFRKAKWIKIPTGRSRTIYKKIFLKARPRWRKIRYRTDSSGFAYLTKTVLDPAYRPHVWRELVVPVFRKHIVRPAGLRPIKLRLKKTVETYDWFVIKASYLAKKSELLDQRDKRIAPLVERKRTLERLIHSRRQVPHRMATHTTVGFIPLSAGESYGRAGLLKGDPVYLQSRALRSRYSLLGTSCGLGVIGPNGMSNVGSAAYLFSAYEAASAIFQAKSYSETGTEIRDQLSSAVKAHQTAFEQSRRVDDPDLSIEDQSIAHARTTIQEIKLLDVATDNNDEAAEALAVQNVASLRGSEDYVFHLVRSIGELKDSRATFKQGYDFVRWLKDLPAAKPPIQALKAWETTLQSTGKGALALVAMYLSWRFAIQPTIQDVQTVAANSREWLTATRRALRDVVRELTDSGSTIYHCREKVRVGERFDTLPNRAVLEKVADSPTRVTLTWHEYLYPESMMGVQFGQIDRAAPFVSYRDRQDLEPVAFMDGQRPVDVGERPDFQLLEGWETAFARVSPPTAILDCDVAIENKTERMHLEGAMLDRENLTQVVAEDSVINGSVLFPDKSNNAYIKTLKQVPKPAVGVTGYLKNQVTGVAFARYRVEGLLSLMGLDQGSQGLMNLLRLGEKAPMLLDTLNAIPSTGFSQGVEKAWDSWVKLLVDADSVYVGWQLYPLSFVAEWFTNLDSIVKRIAALQHDFTYPAPPAMDGVWARKRVDLWAGRPSVELASEKVYDRVMEWHTSCYGQSVTRDYNGRTNHGTSLVVCTAPAKVHRRYEFEYVVDSNVYLQRSGLYRAVRGEAVSGDWKTFLPQIRIHIDASKIATLLGMLAGILRPRK